MGRAATRLLGANGASIALLDLNTVGMQAVADEMEKAGHQTISLRADVSRSDEVDKAVDDTVKAFGRLDVLVHCAAAAPWRSGGADDSKRICTVVEMTDQEWLQIISIDLDGTFYLCRAAARVMIPHGSGTMVLIASDRALSGQKGGAHYAAAKAGVIALAKSLAVEIGPHNVTVNAIDPGATDTHEDVTPERRRQRTVNDPLGKMCQPEDIAGAVASSHSGRQIRHRTTRYNENVQPRLLAYGPEQRSLQHALADVPPAALELAVQPDAAARLRPASVVGAFFMLLRIGVALLARFLALRVGMRAER